MKNSTILKDELSLLNADKSAVVMELRRAGEELKGVYELIEEAKSDLAEVRDTILEETARLDDLRGRAVSVSTELAQYTQDLKNVTYTWETTKVKNSQENKLHLGRVRELKDEERSILKSISDLKATYDRNSDMYSQHVSEKNAHLRALDKEIKEKGTEAIEVSNKLQKDKDEDKKLTKDRLKREDKLRARERVAEMKESALAKKEEDLMTMSKDIVVVYGRLKELYAKEYPTVDLDKLVLQAT